MEGFDGVHGGWELPEASDYRTELDLALLSHVGVQESKAIFQEAPRRGKRGSLPQWV
jgi:hypothetical protein